MTRPNAFYLVVGNLPGGGSLPAFFSGFEVFERGRRESICLSRRALVSSSSGTP